jgi:carbon-monoxide dehydrogenase medium subunit
VYLPPSRDGIGIYKKFARVSGDFAIASVALTATRQIADRTVRIAIGGCGPRPISLTEVDAMLSARLGDRDTVKSAGDYLAAASDPVDDVRASADYRRRIIPRLVMSVVAEANAALVVR